MKLLIVLSVVLIFLALPVLAFAEEEEQKEEITLTTYYPAPYGDYTDLTVDTLHLNPRTDTPTVWDASGHSGAPGELAYAEGDGKLYYSNGSTWVAAGGGGTGVMYLSCGVCCSTPHSIPPPTASCTPPPCPSGWTSVSVFSQPIAYSVDYNEFTRLVSQTVRVCTK